MPVTFAPPQAKSPAAVEIDGVEIEDGVIEEARRRQRRRRRAIVVATGGSSVIVALALSFGGGGRGHAGTPAEPSPGAWSRVALVHGRAFVGGSPAVMGIAPSLQAGNVGVCVMGVGVESCGPLPTAAYPVYGGSDEFNREEEVGPAGEIDTVFTGPGVAAMRVAHIGTFKAQRAPGLPPGAKEIVFYRPPGSRGTVLLPGIDPHELVSGFPHVHYTPALTETLLGSSGRPIPVGESPVVTLPIGYWQGTQPPPVEGRCAISSSLAGTRMAWGEVAKKIAPDPNIITPGWLTCLNTWFSLNGSSYEAAILLNARSPGKPPATLWGATPVPGHPGLVEIQPVQQEVHYRLPRPTHAQLARALARDTKLVGHAQAERLIRQVEQHTGKEQTTWDVLTPSTVARRVGPAWVLVRGGNSLAQRIAFLRALHVTKIKLPHS